MQSNLEDNIILVSASDITFLERWLNMQWIRRTKWETLQVVIRLVKFYRISTFLKGPSGNTTIVTSIPLMEVYNCDIFPESLS